MAKLTADQKLDLVNKIMSDIQQFRQILVVNDIGILAGLKIHFLGDEKPTSIKISTTRDSFLYAEEV